jgi:hypothetical protein
MKRSRNVSPVVLLKLSRYPWLSSSKSSPSTYLHSITRLCMPLRRFVLGFSPRSIHKSIRPLFVNELRDLHSAELWLTQVPPDLARGVHSRELRGALEQHVHVKETEEQLSRVERIMAPQLCWQISCVPRSRPPCPTRHSNRKRKLT